MLNRNLHVAYPILLKLEFDQEFRIHARANALGNFLAIALFCLLTPLVFLVNFGVWWNLAFLVGLLYWFVWEPVGFFYKMWNAGLLKTILKLVFNK